MRDPDTRRIYVVDEYVGTHRPVRDFAREVYEKFAKKREDQEQPRKLRIMYLSPDAWNDRGDQHTLAGQMNEVLQAHGLVFVKAKNDKAGGAMLTYEMLRDGTLQIAENCTLLAGAIESAEHDKANPEAILSIPNDPETDARDAFRYGIYSYHQEALKPVDVRVAERVQTLWKQDPTAAMFQAGQIREQEQAKGKPQFYGGPARRRIQQWERSRKS